MVRPIGTTLPTIWTSIVAFWVIPASVYVALIVTVWFEAIAAVLSSPDELIVA
jgi:hypothetical protein